jgi:hypothetical protein
MAITLKVPTYESQRKLLDYPYPFIVFPILTNGTVSVGSTNYDLQVGQYPNIAVHILANVLNANTLAGTLQDLNEGSFQAELGGATVASAQEINSLGPQTATFAATAPPFSTELLLTNKCNSEFVRLTLTAATNPVTGVYCYLVLRSPLSTLG